MKRILNLSRSPTFPWIVLFIVSCFLVKQFDNENPKTRFAALRAITESHQIHIDQYKEWTMDWSLSPNGHYYSNKAPGSVFLGLPVFWVTDVIAKQLESPTDKSIRPYPSDLQHLLFTTIMQIIPFALLVLWGSKKIAEMGCQRKTQHFFALAALFGNTASIYMDAYFGHGLAAIFFLLFIILWIERNYLWASFWLSLTLLTDYMGLTFVPFFAAATLYRERNFQAVMPALLGATPALIAWCWYHNLAFGSPFTIATTYNNPIYIVEDTQNTVPGFSLLPDPVHILELIFGPSRGLLFTQPWVLALFLLVPSFKNNRYVEKGMAVLLLGGFSFALWINAGYSLWEAGWCAGPRYLAFCFPALAFFAALVYEKASVRWREALVVTLAASLTYRLLIFPHSNIAPIEPLWSHYTSLYFKEGSQDKVWMLILISVLSGITALWVRLRKV